jgi:hypothetical protein
MFYSDPETYGKGFDKSGNTQGGMYYMNPHYSDNEQQARNTVMWWNPNVMARYDKLVKAISNKI